mmetsp:Transcript_9778/g.12055  ORF Transcript_9778/g.12055 Transcript_9778/m.12055 type:complete len:108 (-) Transcript_9778:31-354(-)
MSASYLNVKRKYFSALNIALTAEPVPNETTEPQPIPLPGAEDYKADFPSPLSCPIDITAPEGKGRKNLELSGGSFVPPHLYARERGREDTFSVYEYEKKRIACKKAY